MRRAVLWLSVLLVAGGVQADEVPIDSLPQPVVETANQNKGSGTIQHAESYLWGNAVIYRIEIDLDGKPGLELQIADNGKLIRIDQLGEPRDEGPNPTEGSPGSQQWRLAFSVQETAQQQSWKAELGNSNQARFSCNISVPFVKFL